MINLLIKGNLKMGKNVYLFNLPPVVTCKPTKWCLAGRNGKPACYALRNNFIFPSVKKAAKERLRLSKLKNFTSRMIKEINKKNVKYFRWHSSGDFYSKEYIRKVFKIAKNCPETLFRTTTRRRDFKKELIELNSLPNFIVRESLDTEIQKPMMCLPFAALSFLKVTKKKGVYCCKNDCVKCRYLCWHKPVNMCFDEH